jgi:hypothetical protein
MANEDELFRVLSRLMFETPVEDSQCLPVTAGRFYEARPQGG